MKEVIVIIIITVIVWFGWSHFFATDYSKPWWNGNEVQKVCATTGAENCYSEVVSSDGENIDGISMSGGGFIEATSSECVKASHLKDSRLCRMWDSNEVKWDITKE